MATPPRPGRPQQRKRRSGNPAVRSGVQPPPVAPTRPKASPDSKGSKGSPAASGVADPSAVEPVDGSPYPSVLRAPGYHPARSVAGVVFGLSLFLLLTAVVGQLVVFLGWALTAGNVPYVDYSRSALAFERPVGMLGANLGIMTLSPIACAIIWIVHRVRPRWLLSVGPGIRWRYLVICLGIALVSLNGMLLLSRWATSAEPLAVQAQPGLASFLIVVLLTSPLQAAAEEIFFRGYLMQALGSLVAQPWFGVVVSAVVFALLHGTQNLPLFLDRLAFGLLAGLLVWRTGGLEAGIAAHVVNNVFAYLIAGLTTGIATLKSIQGIGWVNAAFDVGGFALFALLAALAARALRLRHTVDLTGGSVVVR